MSELVAVTPVAAPLAPARRELPIKRWAGAAVLSLALIAGGALLSNHRHAKPYVPVLREAVPIPPAPKAPEFNFHVPAGPLVAPLPTIPPQVLVPPEPIAKAKAPAKKTKAKAKRPAK